MAQLLHCPTCNGIVSSNASSCPHCGETKLWTIEYYDTSVTCNYCKGTGRVKTETKLPVTIDYSGNFNFGKVSTGKCEYRTDLYDSDGAPGVWTDIEVDADSPQIRNAKNAVASGMYRIERMLDGERRSYNWRFDHYIFFDAHYESCPCCNGSGKVMERKSRRACLCKGYKDTSHSVSDEDFDSLLDNYIQYQIENNNSNDDIMKLILGED